ncbi:MAG: N(4)-(beta-N-acetylglucosaminyl)-L-asparaginase [Planctomycetota bacterium]|nr:N(4)-(beta-N-acetylglucosaminyl)-L-asparaginase [Planctomycetota bacterium]
MKAIASHNGLIATERAIDILQRSGSSLDACVEGVTFVEDDPEELTVGYGGLPNEDGVVELDAAVMDGITHRGGAVAALRNVRHATKVARLVMEQTNRVMLAGDGALQFALANGFLEENLLTEKSRRMWHYWRRRRSAADDWIPPDNESELDLQQWFDKEFYGGGTVHCAVVSGDRDLSAATSTSGHAFKLAGRVGDSPILGAGLYVDNEVGSCGAIGHGEASMQNCSSYAAVELMRGGLAPEQAGLEALRRVVAKTPGSNCDAEGRPRFNLQLYLLAKDGAHAGAALWGPKQLAVSDDGGTRLEPCAALYQREK